MGNELFDLLKEFNRANLITWSKEAFSFFKSPRKFVELIKNRPGIDLISQYAFYFLVYTFSYLFFSLGLSLNELLKPALLSFTTMVPTILIFSLSARIANGRGNLKKTVIFIISLNLFLSPLLIILYALFLNTEDYFYRLILNLISLGSSLFMLFGYGFAITNSLKKGFRIVIVNYLLVNLLWLLVTRVNFDEYGGTTAIMQTDPIYDEYNSATHNLKNKDKIPVHRLILVYKEKIFSTFTTQDIISEMQSSGDNSSNNQYKRENESNIKQLTEKLKDIRFQRNISAISKWLDYYLLINEEIYYTISDTNELKNLNLKLLSFDDSSGIKSYIMTVPLDSIFPLQFELKRYHNNLIKSSQKSNVPNKIGDIAFFLIGKLINDGLFELLNEGKSKIYKEKFLDLE